MSGIPFLGTNQAMLTNDRVDLLNKIPNDKNIKAILFDLVGVLVFKKEDYIPVTPNEINA